MGMEDKKLQKEAATNRSRILSDAELIKGGAKVGVKGKINITEGQMLDMQARLKLAKEVIDKLESHWFQEELGKLREQGKGLARDMYELHGVADRIKLNEWFVTHNVALSGEIREDGVKEFKENQEKFEKLRKQLGGFFRECNNLQKSMVLNVSEV